MQEPPGGPPDADPPILLSVRPDSGSVNPGYDRAVRFQFDEVISEVQGRLGDFVLVSPRPEAVDVGWKRTAIEVKPDGGWRPDAVYQVTLLPGITDLRNNRLQEHASVVFSTGGPIPDTELSGTVLNWDAARAAPRALVEAIRMPDSLVYVAQADSVGDFRLVALPPGEYHLITTVDDNNNRRRDRREAFDSMVVTLDSLVSGEVLWAFVHDTTGPALRSASLVDSLTVRITFGQKLAPGDPEAGAVLVRELPDSLPVPVANVWRPAVWDSLRGAEQAARADTAIADTTVADTAQAGGVEVAPDTTAPRAAGEPAVQDTSRIALLLARRPHLIDAWVVRLARALAPGSRYVFEATATNPNGATAQSRTLLIVPEATDTTGADTTASDTTGMRRRPR